VRARARLPRCVVSCRTTSSAGPARRPRGRGSSPASQPSPAVGAADEEHSVIGNSLAQALLVTIIALWLLGGVWVSATVRWWTWTLLAFALAVAALAWWRVLRPRGPR
jgi:hypothetical protein